jgi:hypothetical protein
VTVVSRVPIGRIEEVFILVGSTLETGAGEVE